MKLIKGMKIFVIEITGQEINLPIMYWLPKKCKSPTGARFIVASKICSANPLSDVISKVFKMVFNHVESFHTKHLFYKCFKKFWVVPRKLIPYFYKTESNKCQEKSQKYFNFQLYHIIYNNSS